MQTYVVKIDDTGSEPFWLTLKLRSRETVNMKSRNPDVSFVEVRGKRRETNLDGRRSLMKNFTFGILVLNAVCVLGKSLSAQVLYTTQQDFGAATTASGATITVGPPGATGDSDLSTINGLANTVNPGGAGTAGAIFMQVNTLGYDQANLGDEAANSGFLAALRNNTQLTLDYTLPQDLTTGASGYFQIWGVFNWSGGYQQFNNNAFFNGANLLAGTHTVTFDYSSLQPGLPTSQPSYFQLFLVMNCGGSLSPGANVPIYIDNIRVSSVPEPSTLALMGLPVVMFLIRRRRRG